MEILILYEEYASQQQDQYQVPTTILVGPLVNLIPSKSWRSALSGPNLKQRRISEVIQDGIKTLKTLNCEHKQSQGIFDFS